MARPRHPFRDGPPPAVVYFLARGTTPPGPSSEGDGDLHAFRLWGRWNRRREKPEVVAEFRELWARHADEIRAATPPGRDPWLQRVLEASE